MNPVVTPDRPLAVMRDKKGLKIAAIIDQARKEDPQFPTTHAGYLGIEENGTRDYWKIRALAIVFKITHRAMADILHPDNYRK